MLLLLVKLSKSVKAPPIVAVIIPLVSVSIAFKSVTFCGVTVAIESTETATVEKSAIAAAAAIADALPVILVLTPVALIVPVVMVAAIEFKSLAAAVVPVTIEFQLVVIVMSPAFFAFTTVLISAALPVTDGTLTALTGIFTLALMTIKSVAAASPAILIVNALFVSLLIPANVAALVSLTNAVIKPDVFSRIAFNSETLAASFTVTATVTTGEPVNVKFEAFVTKAVLMSAL